MLTIRKDILQYFRHQHGSRIKLDRKGLSSSELSVRIRGEWAAGLWIAHDNHVFNFFDAGRARYKKWGLIRGTDPRVRGQDGSGASDGGQGDRGRGQDDHANSSQHNGGQGDRGRGHDDRANSSQDNGDAGRSFQMDR